MQNKYNDNLPDLTNHESVRQRIYSDGLVLKDSFKGLSGEVTNRHLMQIKKGMIFEPNGIN